MSNYAILAASSNNICIGQECVCFTYKASEYSVLLLGAVF